MVVTVATLVVTVVIPLVASAVTPAAVVVVVLLHPRGRIVPPVLARDPGELEWDEAFVDQDELAAP